MAEPAWLEISLNVNGEIAEAAAEVFSRYVEGGVVIERTTSGIIKEGDEGQMRVYGYLPVTPELENAKKQVERSLLHLGQIQNIPAPTFRYIEEENWMESWKVHYRPIEIGDKFLILPAWLDPPANNERLAIHINPGMAFGTGTHPSTQLCLELMESHVVKGDVVIDVGCGSGILSIAAVKLGAANILAVDVDEAALRSAEENIKINHVSKSIELAIGSLPEILKNDYSIFEASLVVVNILPRTLIQLIRGGLAKLLTKSGVMILSGILEEREGDFNEVLRSHGLETVERRRRDDWIGLVVRAQMAIATHNDPEHFLQYH